MLVDRVVTGSIVKVEGRTYCVRRKLSEGEVETIDIETSQIKRWKLSEMSAVVQLHDTLNRTDLVSIVDTQSWDRAIQCYQIISPLLEIEQSTKSAVVEVAKTAQVSPATVYRWLERFRKSGTVSSLIRKERSDNGKNRITETSEKFMNDVIREVFLTDQGLSPTLAYRRLQALCRKANVEVPNISTFRRRLKLLAPAVLATSREGKQSGRRFRSIRGEFPGADYPYAVLQIDHTTVDIILVDETHRLPVQRPYITVAIDVYSRMVAGYYISFDPPGVLGTGMCIANAVLNKQTFLESKNLKYAWPCQGLPRVIHVDNAKEFRGNTLKMACNEYQIDLQFRPVRQPNYGGHIERLMGTLMAEIHALPGTTKSNVAALGEYNSSKKAAMTLSEFEDWFANMVLGSYHQRVHSELHLPPIVKFNEGVLGNDRQPGVGLPQPPTDETQFRIDFLPFEMRSVQPYGIAVDGIYYQADVLTRWIGSSDPIKTREARKFIVRRDPRDISYILFFDPEVKRYFRIPYQNPRYPAISLWELRAIKRFLKEQGRKAEDQDIIFAAFDEMQRIEEDALKQTKTVRIEQARRTARKDKLSKEKPKDQESDAISHPLKKFEDLEIKPFDDVEDI